MLIATFDKKTPQAPQLFVAENVNWCAYGDRSTTARDDYSDNPNSPVTWVIGM